MKKGLFSPRKHPGQLEFVTLSAMLIATVAFSIDGMLPAEPEIAQALSPDNLNRVKLVIGSFFLGLGIGTVFSGPLSDTFGRRPIIIWGGVLYSIAAFMCWRAQSLDVLLIGRVLQGLGAAAPRTVVMAIVRDLYKGRRMAQIMSFIMAVFVLVPAAAPLFGQQIIRLFGWQALFLAFIIFSVTALVWMGHRLPETLPAESRRPLEITALISATREVFSHRIVVVSIFIQALTQAVLIANLSSVQGIFSLTFNREESFPLWFATTAVLSGSASLFNARIVMNVGMRKVIHTTYIAVLFVAILQVIVIAAIPMDSMIRFATFYIWLVCTFAMLGLTMGNLNTLAMEPVGHIAGLAASIIAALSTVLAVVVSMPVAQAFDGTEGPLAIGVLIYIVLILALVPLLGKGRDA